jgi:UDP-GlcNAc3NAcA epimerase
MTRKIVTVLGARPQFIKASVVSHVLREQGKLNEILVHTGQHYDANMSDVFFAELGMNPPHHFLDVHGGGHGVMTGRMLSEVERVLLQEKPSAVLVYGDTNSTLAGALAAVKLGIPIAHVEAGLRSFNMAMPEEVNRILTDRISRWLFAPTDAACQHLLREGFAPSQIYAVGDVMLDVALHHGAKVTAEGGLLKKFGLTAHGYVSATIHRAENTDHPARLAAIVNALSKVAEKLPVVWPMHPRTRAILMSSGLQSLLPPSVLVVDPLGYLDMVQLEKYSAVIATDSGGVQKEAFFYGVPCVTLRDETEWVELIDAGWNRLARPSSGPEVANAILSAVGSKGSSVSPYGAGDAANKIVEQITKDLFR